MLTFPCVALITRVFNLVRYTCLYLVALTLTLWGPTLVLADGMVPDTSVVIVNEADGEASVSVTNTDSKLALLHVTLEDIPEDTTPLLFVTPPLTRVEPGKSQLIRFILQSPTPLTAQRLKRVIFEGRRADHDVHADRCAAVAGPADSSGGRLHQHPDPRTGAASGRPGLLRTDHVVHDFLWLTPHRHP